MNSKRRFTVAFMFALILAAFVASAAYAHACTNGSKPIGPGSVGTYNVVTETFEPNQPNGGFVTFTDGTNFWVDIYIHHFLPEGALASGPGGDDMCDGQGVDLFLACIGVALD